MRELGLVACQPRPWRTTTVRDGEQTATPDPVVRNFTPTRPAAKLVGDITYVPTWAGWLYLAAVIDCFNKEVIGHAMADHMRTSLVGDALEMAARNRPLAAGCIFHSDSEYGRAGVSGFLDSRADGPVRMLVSRLSPGILTSD